MAKPSHDRPNWARKLVAARVAHAWSAEVFAQKLGCGQSTLRNAEAGNPRGVGKVMRSLPDVLDPTTAEEIIREWELAAASPIMTSPSQLRRRAEDAYDDVDVLLTLTPATAPFLHMTAALTVTTRSSSWIVGVTTDELVADQLCALTPLVNETVCPGPDFDQQAGIAFSLSCHDLRKRRVRPSAIPMELVEPELLARRTGDDIFTEYSGVDWYLGDIGASEPDASSHRLTFQNRHLIDYRARYCYWSAGRDMYLRSLRVDATSFPKTRSHRLSLQPFLSVPMSVSTSGRTGYYELAVEGLVAAGNGVAFVWGDES